MKSMDRAPTPMALWVGVGTVALLAATPVSAYTNFTLDQLTVKWSNASANINVEYVDSFDNGDPLVGGAFTNNGSPTGSIGGYFAATRTGAAPSAGSEAGGKQRFFWEDMADSTFGGVITGRSLNYTLFTSTQYTADNGTPLQNRGLWKGNNFSVQTIWELTLPQVSDHPRMRLTDGFTGHPSNDLLDLSLWRLGDGYQLRSRRLNILPGSTDELVSSGDISGFANGADQIMLSFSHVAGDAFVSSSYTFLKDGLTGYSAPVGTLSLFNGEDWTRASYGSYALSAPIPEPQTYALMLLGLAGMGAVARRRKR